MSDCSIIKYEFRLTTPKSVNGMYNIGRGRGGKRHFFMNKDAHETKDLLIKEIKAYAAMNKCPNFKNTIVIAEVIAVNFRKGRDLNNITKTLYDAFEDAEIVDNDKCIIDRFLYKEYTDEDSCYIKVFLYEPKGVPTIEDVENYFFWANKKLLNDMIRRTF